MKPDFFRSLTIAGLSLGARLTFVGLWTYVDDEGIGLDSVDLIKADVWPLDRRYGGKQIAEWLTELAEAGLIVRYGAGGRRFLQVRSWSEHQRIDKPRPSSLPMPAEGVVLDASGSVPGAVPESSGSAPGVVRLGREGKGREGKGTYGAAPRRDALFEAIAEACGVDWHALTPSARSPLNRATMELRAVEATPEEVRLRAGRYRERMPDVELTPNALAKHWPRLSTGRHPASASTRAAVEAARDARREPA